MPQQDDELRERTRKALDDEGGKIARERAALTLAIAMRDVGHTLWHAGYFVGPDRPAGASPFQFGSDITVGIATGLQIGGELISGAASLLSDGNRYAAMALIRQIVEVEYVGWAFAEDEMRTGVAWLRSSHAERAKLWQPRHLRDSSNGRFRANDYRSHCELGGHPTPDAHRLLPDHTNEMHEGWIWLELCTHGRSAWDYFLSAAMAQGYAVLVGELASVQSLADEWQSWRASDPLVLMADQVRTLIAGVE